MQLQPACLVHVASVICIVELIPGHAKSPSAACRPLECCPSRGQGAYSSSRLQAPGKASFTQRNHTLLHISHPAPVPGGWIPGRVTRLQLKPSRPFPKQLAACRDGHQTQPCPIPDDVYAPPHSVLLM